MREVGQPGRFLKGWYNREMADISKLVQDYANAVQGLPSKKRDPLDTYAGCLCILSGLFIVTSIAALVVGVVLAIRNWW